MSFFFSLDLRSCKSKDFHRILNSINIQHFLSKMNFQCLLIQHRNVNILCPWYYSSVNIEIQIKCLSSILIDVGSHSSGNALKCNIEKIYCKTLKPGVG